MAKKTCIAGVLYRYVIERIFERGDAPEICNCQRYYGDEKVRDVLLNARFFAGKTDIPYISQSD